MGGAVVASWGWVVVLVDSTVAEAVGLVVEVTEGNCFVLVVLFFEIIHLYDFIKM